MVLSNPWMSDPSLIDEAVVETQAPKNIPARIAAVAIYGALRGCGVNAGFSGSALKAKAMAEMADRMDVQLIKQPEKLPKTADAKERAKRRRLMHKVNKDNSKMLMRKALERMEDAKTNGIFDAADGKEDDLSDAMLLGIGACSARKKSILKSVRSKGRAGPKSKIIKEKEDGGDSPVH